MRVGLLSDIHGNAPAMRAALKELRPKADKILFLGDMAGYYPFVNECMEMWEEETMTGVRGNHDAVLIECLESGAPPPEAYRAGFGSAIDRCLPALSERARRILRSWPDELELKLGSARVHLFHGAPWDKLEGRVYPDFKDWEIFRGLPADFVLLGHTHYPFTRRVGGVTLVNPGSVGQPRDGIQGASYGLFDTESREVTLARASYDAAPVAEDAHRHEPALPYLAKVLTR